MFPPHHSRSPPTDSGRVFTNPHNSCSPIPCGRHAHSVPSALLWVSTGCLQSRVTGIASQPIGPKDLMMFVRLFCLSAEIPGGSRATFPSFFPPCKLRPGHLNFKSSHIIPRLLNFSSHQHLIHIQTLWCLQPLMKKHACGGGCWNNGSRTPRLGPSGGAKHRLQRFQFQGGSFLEAARVHQ